MQRLVTALLRVLGILAALYFALCVLIWRYQDRLAFPSPKSRLPEPSAFHIPGGERIRVTTSDGVELQGWYLPPHPAPPAGAKAPGLIWFYGNMETIAAIAPVIRYFQPGGTGLVVLDYRGYGESAGTETEDGIYRDAEAAWTYLATRPEIDSSRIAVYGRSVGSVPALYLATIKPLRALVLESPFTSAREMASQHYGYFPHFLIRLSLDNLARAARLTVPLLVFHGTADRIAPIAMGQAVAKAGHGTLIRLVGHGHNDTYESEDSVYRDRMWEFLRNGEEGSGKREE